jgi:hypothetical protein
MNPLSQEDLMEQAKIEARAKVIWGESPKKVIFFLRTKGVSMEEAIQITDEAFAERKAEVRAKGVQQFLIGVALLFLPVGGYFIYAAIGGLSILGMLIFGLAAAAGLYGLYCIVNGLWALFVPKEEEEESSDF